MEIDLYTVLGSGGVTAVIQGAFALFIRRYLERRDAELNSLSHKVDEMKDKELRRIEEGVDEGKRGRAVLHQRINAETVSKEHCNRMHEEFDRRFLAVDDLVKKMERISVRTDTSIERQEQLLLQNRELTKELAAVSERIKDIR